MECKLVDWKKGQVCGVETGSREERLEHIQEVHTPSPMQWTEAYRKIQDSEPSKKSTGAQER